jgi:hypothetical protein
VGEKLKGAAEGLQSAAEKVGEDLKEAAPHMPELPDSGGPGESGGPAGGPAPSGPESPGSPFGPEPTSGGPFESILS